MPRTKILGYHTDNHRYLIVGSVAIGLGTMLIDLSFHSLFTFPNEVAGYFAAKFLLATLVAIPMLMVTNMLVGAFEGALVFDVFTGLYYYLAQFTSSPLLSCCYVTPPSVLGNTNYWFNLSAFIVVHFVAFFISFLIVAAIVSSHRRRPH